jgi:hypothetical protein
VYWYLGNRYAWADPDTVFWLSYQQLENYLNDDEERKPRQTGRIRRLPAAQAKQLLRELRDGK